MTGDRTAVLSASSAPLRGCVVSLIVLALTGCQSPPGPIFPEISPPIVWPPPPDVPRIRYIGELRGEASLGAQPSGWEAFQAALSGPKPKLEFSNPSAIAVLGQKVFVADMGIAAVHVLDLAHRKYGLIRGSPQEPFNTPIAVALAGPDTLAVVDRGRAALDLFDAKGNWRATQRWPEIQAPVAVAWDAASNRLWVADVAAHACFSVQDGRELQGRLGTRGSGPGQFNFPRSVACHPSAGLAVLDAMNFRVQLFDQSIRPIAIFGHKGNAAGDFAQPRAIAFDSEAHIYVLDHEFDNVQIFDTGGRLLMAFGRSGQGPGEFSLPSGIAIDPQDRIWIVDTMNRRVQVFQYLREGVATVAAPPKPE